MLFRSKSESQLAEEESGDYAEGEWVEVDGQLVWQPAEGGEAISAAEAGYAGVTPTTTASADEADVAEAPAEQPTESVAAAPDGGEADDGAA